MKSSMKREIDGDILEVPPSGQERILFVDDEDLYVIMGSRLLESQGYHVTVKKDGAEAFELFSFKPRAFDLVITGQTLPGMTGIELAQKILNVRPDIPVILCTACSEIAEEEANELGLQRFMMKPFDAIKLTRTIRKMLDEKVIR